MLQFNIESVVRVPSAELATLLADVDMIFLDVARLFSGVATILADVDMFFSGVARLFSGVKRLFREVAKFFSVQDIKIAYLEKKKVLQSF